MSSSLRSCRVLASLTGLVLGAGLLVAGGPAAAAADGLAVPACSYDAEPTARTDLEDWDRTLLDPRYGLDEDYAPDDLVPVSDAGVDGTGLVRELVVEDLAAMTRAAREADAAFAVHSAYRSFADQERVFGSLRAAYGLERAREISAQPGHSEHQLGTAVDLRSAEDPRTAWQYEDWGATAAGAWLRENSWRYGFVLSYPSGETALTCYDYEPWHFRYVGRDVAAEVRASGLTLREHLWSLGEGPRTAGGSRGVLERMAGPPYLLAR